MKFVLLSSCHLNKLIIFLFLFFLSDGALAENGIIQCKTPDEKNYRVWKFDYANGEIKMWTLNDGRFYPFCSVGFLEKLPNGLLCSYKKDKKIGTVATFVDIQQPGITDILIREDTILIDPTTWKQKVENSCELILE